MSSTFGDLREERERVTWKLLKDHHIPAGMETFPAADDRGWETIRRAIDDSDYYVLIVGWRYGSIVPGTTLSWTHREYRYAKERNIPILAFLREEDATPYSKTDHDAGAQVRAFREEIQSEKLYGSWRHGEDLCNAVGEALWRQIRNDEDEGTERPGWFRGDAGIVSAETLDELARLSQENHSLRTQLDAVRLTEPAQLSLELPPSTQVLTFHPWQPWSAAISLPTGPSTTTTVKADDFKRWVDALACTFWLPLTLVNTGRTTATDVLVDLTIPRCRRILLERPEAGPITDTPSPVTLQRASNPGLDAYIQRVGPSGDGFEVRHRIKRVLGKSSEHLVFFGAVLDDRLDWPSDSVIDVAFSIRDSTGVVHDGTVTTPIVILQGEPLNAVTAQAFYARHGR
ncbi:MAG TPA: DUF4062 domain-containing protein [Nannocystis sp.]